MGDARFGGGHVRPPAVALLALAVLAAATVQAAVSWTSTAGVLTTGVAPPPVEFAAGAGAANHRYFKQFTLSENNTSFSAVVRAKPGADMTVEDVVRVASRSASSRSVTLSATQTTNAQVEVFTWTIRDGATTVGRLDSLDADPRITFTLPASATFTMDLRVDLADGSGRNNANTAFDVTMEVA